MPTYISSGLTDDLSKPESMGSEDIDLMIERLQPFGPALEEVKERVFVSYGDVG